MTDTAALPDIAISEIKHDSAEIEHLVTPFKVSRIGLGTMGDQRMDVGRNGRSGGDRRHPRGGRSWRPSDRYRAGLRLRPLGGDRGQGAG